MWFDLHHVVGFYSTAPLPPAPVGFPFVRPISPDQALEIARAAIPGATPFNINVPGPKGVYRIAARFPEDRTPGGRSRIYIHQFTGQVLQAEGSRTAPAGARVIVNRAIHTGDIFGIPSKLVMSLASLMAVIQLVSGVVMWAKRERGPAARSPC